MSLETVEKQAKYLADENRATNPDVKEVYWFPHDSEVRLIEVTDEIPVSEDGMAHPTYFRPAPTDNLPQPSGIALIRPDEVKRVKLPDPWGGWERAKKI